MIKYCTRMKRQTRITVLTSKCLLVIHHQYSLNAKINVELLRLQSLNEDELLSDSDCWKSYPYWKMHTKYDN